MRGLRGDRERLDSDVMPCVGYDRDFIFNLLTTEKEGYEEFPEFYA